MDKQFEGILIVNYKTGKMRVTKRKSKTSHWEIPIQIKLKMIIPDQKQIVASGEIEVPPNKVIEMSIESL